MFDFKEIKRLEDEQEKEVSTYKKRRGGSAIAKGIKDGALVKSNCVLCDSDYRVQGHHQDYDQPSHVIWLCRQHHIMMHRVGVKYTLFWIYLIQSLEYDPMSIGVYYSKEDLANMLCVTVDHFIKLCKDQVPMTKGIWTNFCESLRNKDTISFKWFRDHFTVEA